MNNIAIILPAYNEELTIASTIEAFYAQLPDANIVVIDNNSKDNTGIVASQTLEKLKTRGKVITELRQGKGNAVRRGFMDIDADIYIMADADLTYPADRVHDLIAPILNNEADMVVGDRLSGGHYKSENKRNFHGFGNNLVKWLINNLFKAKLKDIMSGYRAFNKRFVKNYPIMVEGFQVETDLTLHALDKRFRIHEMVIEYKDRPEGSFSKLNTFSDGAKVLFTISSILRHYRPFAFFGSLALIFCLSGLVSSIPVFQDWILHKYIFHVPLALLAVAFELLAAISFAVALILDSVAHQNKLSFERNLLNSK